jgi:pyruvate dehydrogenase E1 component alpha subunit
MGHFEGDPDRYRDDEDRSALLEHDAIPPLRELILTRAHATEEGLETMRAEIESAIDEAVEFARSSPFPDPADIQRYVYPEQAAHAEVA